MIVEVAEFRVKAEDHAEFGKALAAGVEKFLSKSRGYRSHRILGGIESPGRYLLVVQWESLEDHMEGFRGGPTFADWRAVISPFFVQPPQMEHFVLSDGT